jgi:hypothetical protein
MIDTSLEHFSHIEDVVAFVKRQLPENANHDAWKNVCEDVLHCELTKVEPLLLKELDQANEHSNEEEHIRSLVRAASWYTHPQLTQEQLLAKIDQLVPKLQGNLIHQLQTIRTAIQTPKSGTEARDAAEVIEALIAALNTAPTDTETQTTLRELRDQIYYQLLYPHWFAIVTRWKQNRPKN